MGKKLEFAINLMAHLESSSKEKLRRSGSLKLTQFKSWITCGITKLLAINNIINSSMVPESIGKFPTLLTIILICIKIHVLNLQV